MKTILSNPPENQHGTYMTIALFFHMNNHLPSLHFWFPCQFPLEVWINWQNKTTAVDQAVSNWLFKYVQL